MNHKSYDLVENKLNEAKYFLKQMRKDTHDGQVLGYCFSAFVSAGRSITMALERNMSKVDGFKQWYAEQQEKLKTNPLMRIMNDARIDTIHKGIVRVGVPGIYIDEQGHLQLTNYLINTPDNPAIRDYGDVFQASELYINSIQQLLDECKQRFPEFTEPGSLFTIEGLKARKMTIEDLEEQLGFDRGWTKGIPKRERLRLLEQSTPPLIYKELFRDIADIEKRKPYLGE